MQKRKLKGALAIERAASLVLLAGAALMLGSCSPKQAAGGTSAAPAEISTGYPISREKINLTCAITGYAINSNPRLIWEKLEELTNIHVEFFGIEAEQLAPFMAAGEWPDFFHNPLAASYINDYGIMGNQFVDYNTVLPYMPHLVKAFEDYPASRKLITETNGAIYQLPVYEKSATVNWARFYYRKDNLRQLNLKVPETIDEFYDTLVALKNAFGTAPMVVVMDYIELWFFPSFGDSPDAEFGADAADRVVFNRTSEQYKRYLTFINKLYREGLLHREFLTLDAATQLSMAKQNQMTFAVTPFQNLVIEDFPSGEFDLGVPKPFKSQWNDHTMVKGMGAERKGGFAVSAKSKYIPQTARMLDVAFAASEVVPGTGIYGNAFGYGPEGLTWRFTNAEKTEYEFMLPPEHQDLAFSVYQFDWAIYGNTGREDAFANAVTTTVSNNRTRQLEFLENLNPYSRTDYFPVSFLKFTEDEQMVIDNRYTDINTYCTEMRSKFITGVANIDAEWDTYRRTVDSMGIADVIRVYQQSYDRWNEL
jgi:putative aldouronate transport system substrate-binding protein